MDNSSRYKAALVALAALSLVLLVTTLFFAYQWSDAKGKLDTRTQEQADQTDKETSLDDTESQTEAEERGVSGEPIPREATFKEFEQVLGAPEAYRPNVKISIFHIPADAQVEAANNRIYIHSDSFGMRFNRPAGAPDEDLTNVTVVEVGVSESFGKLWRFSTSEAPVWRYSTNVMFDEPCTPHVFAPCGSPSVDPYELVVGVECEKEKGEESVKFCDDILLNTRMVKVQ